MRSSAEKNQASRGHPAANSLTRRQGTPVQRRVYRVVSPVVQMAAPGGIEHAMNSCFVAALINTFTVVRPLRNLLIPTNNLVPLGQALGLQDMLWRAVNTVDATHRVPVDWVRQIMAALAKLDIIDNVGDTADFSNVMAQVVAVLTRGGGDSGQANHMPVSTGEVAWYPDQTLESAVYERVEQLQNDAGNFSLAPNSVHVTRGFGNARVAPQTFRLYPADGSTVTYRLKSIVEQDAKYVGGHFVSHIDRGGVGQEWWRSDDLDPGGVAGTDIAATNMQRRGYAYIFERQDVALAHSDESPEVGVARRALMDFYKKDLTSYVRKEQAEPSTASIDYEKIDTRKYDKDIQERKKDEDPTLTTENVGEKVKEFAWCQQEEKKAVGKVNVLLKEYSRFPTVDMYETAQEQMLEARERIKVLHERQAELLGFYMDASTGEPAKRAFLKGIIPGFEETDADLFNRIAAKLRSFSGEKLDPEFVLLRNRYLAYIAQGLGMPSGKGRLVEFDNLLGERNIRVDTVGGEFGAGFADDKLDAPKGQKQEDRAPDQDQALLAKLGGNIPAFIEERFGKGGDRTPGGEAAKTGDLAVYLEKRKKLFPIYFGQGKKGQVELFSSPLFTAMHHETGHLVNYLKGTSGGKNKYEDKADGPLFELTDEEEVYNISVDRYSDKVLSGEMGLPERIAHKSYMGIDAGRDRWEEREVHAGLEKWQGLTGQKGQAKNPLRDLQVQVGQLNIGDAQFHKNLTGLLARVTEGVASLAKPSIAPREERQRLSDAFAWSLDKLEHKVYDRLDLYQRSKYALVKPDEPEFVALGQDLDQIQVEQRKYIAVIIDAKLELWVQGSADDKRAANQDWRALLSNKSGIRIDEAAAPEFKNEAQANIARLLSRKNGRKLVHALISAGNALEISTPDPKVIERFKTAMTHLSAEELEAEINATYGGQAGPKDNSDAAAKRSDTGLERGAGSPSTMAMRTGLKDSEGVSVDDSGKLIFSPNFIELGHEMIHALQNLHGANVKKINPEAYQGSAWDNMSEHSVIGGTKDMAGLLGDDYVTENMLRDDHNLGERYGHSTAGALREAVRSKFHSIAMKAAWDKLGGVGTDKTPKGVGELRKLLAANPVDWKAVKTEVHDRAERWGITTFFKGVPTAATGFYKLIDQYCDLMAVKGNAKDLTVLRNFLDEIKNYNPV